MDIGGTDSDPENQESYEDPQEDLEPSQGGSDPPAAEDTRSTETVYADVEAGVRTPPGPTEDAIEEAFTLQALFPTVARLIGGFRRPAIRGGTSTAHNTASAESSPVINRVLRPEPVGDIISEGRGGGEAADESAMRTGGARQDGDNTPQEPPRRWVPGMYLRAAAGAVLVGLGLGEGGEDSSSSERTRSRGSMSEVGKSVTSSIAIETSGGPASVAPAAGPQRPRRGSSLGGVTGAVGALHNRFNTAAGGVREHTGHTLAQARRLLAENSVSLLSAVPTFLCTICLENTKTTLMFQPKSDAAANGCSHVFCIACLERYFFTRIHEGQVELLPCPGIGERGCRHVFGEEDVRSVVSPLVFKSFLKYRLQQKDDKYRECPRQGCGEMMLGDPASPIMTCPACQASFCFFHGAGHGAETTCSTYTRLRQKEETASEKVIQRLAKNCPKCSRPTEKTGGCNHMTCVCGEQWCWLCGRHCANDHYAPWNVRNGCPGAQFTYQDTGLFARLCPRPAPAAAPPGAAAAAEGGGGGGGCCTRAYCASLWGNIGLAVVYVIIAVPCTVLALLYTLVMALLIFCCLLASPEPILCEQGPPCGPRRRLTMGERCVRAWACCCICAGSGLYAAPQVPAEVVWR